MSEIMNIIQYIFTCILHAVMFLGIVLLPCLCVIAVSQICSSFLRNRITRIIPLKTFIYLTAPGVIVHECGHLVFCLIFGHKVKDVSLFSPRADGTLGYVAYQYQQNNLYQRIGLFFIGTGPVWFGFLVLFLISWLFLPNSIFEGGISETARIKLFFSSFFSLAFWLDFRRWIWFYLALVITAHINLSEPDIRGAWQGAVTLVLLVLIFFLLFGWIRTIKMNSINVGLFLLSKMSPVFCIMFIVSILSFLTGMVCSLLGGRR